MEKSRDTFLQQINKETQGPINNILTYSDVLLKYMEGKLDIGITQEKQIEFLKNIHQSAFSLYSLTSDNLNPTFFDVNSVVIDCVNIHYHSTLMKKIAIKVELEHNLPSLYADEIKFKQIVIGLISLGIEYTPTGGNIKISTSLKTYVDRKCLVLLVEDNGFGLDKEDIQRINQRYEENRQSVIGLNFTSIERLIKMHQGTYKLESTWPFGKRFTVTLPYSVSGSNKDDLKNTLISAKGNNIFPFSPKKKA
jgi:two-component system phosphate regulon sensor histidine kinase PhoR